MSDNKELQVFANNFSQAVYKNVFVKLTLSRKRKNNSDLENVYIKQVEIKGEVRLQFTYHYKFQDIIKNLSTDEANQEITRLLMEDFNIANLLTQERDYELKISKNFTVTILAKKPTIKNLPSRQHDVAKKRFIDISQKYLHLLDITTEDGVVLKSMTDKYRQIEKFVEIIDNLLNKSGIIKLPKINILDMGAGKAYLTFAVYDYLVNHLKLEVNILGVEAQEKLVESSNTIARAVEFKNLNFVKNNIKDFQAEASDVLIALHACDTATDEAIFKAIKLKARLIILSPCCHKQIRTQINSKNILNSITRYGILLERQAELLTDSIRGLILEKYGYRSSIMEFISAEHTGKNLMIVAYKTADYVAEESYIIQKQQEIESLKKMFGIEYHQLEKLLDSNQNSN